MNEIEHSLSRLALAKAIKTPENPKEDSWNKSLIFNQPFIKELHKQKQELYNRQRNKSQQEVQQMNTRYQHRQYNRVSSSSSGSSKSIPKEKRLSEPKQKRISQRACLPSDTEEETYDEEEEEDRTDDENSIRVKKSLLSLPLNKSKTESIGSAKDEGISSPSRGSTSSHSAPATEEEDAWLPPKQPTANEEYYYQTHPMQRPISATPTEEYYYYPMQPKQRPVSATPTEEYYYQAQPMHRPITVPSAASSTSMIDMTDPLYYQRLHLQQLQLQYQQQLYLMSQTPMFYAPAPLHPIIAAESQSYHQTIATQQPMPPPPPPPPHQMSTTTSKKHSKQHSRRLTSTDLRRRAEMMRNSSETSLNRHSGEIAKSSRRQSYF